MSDNTVTQTTEAEHREVRGWKGGPGECGVECACGTTFDGFDSLGEAADLLNAHIVQASNPAGQIVIDPAAGADLAAKVQAEVAAAEADRLHGTPASLAAALRRAADDLDRMGHVQISPISMQLNLQAVSYRGTSEQRKDTVDALSIALVGVPGSTEDCDDPHHRLDFNAREARGDCEVAVYTAVRDHGSAS